MQVPYSTMTCNPALQMAYSQQASSKILTQCRAYNTHLCQTLLLRADDVPDQPWPALGPHHRAHRHSAQCPLPLRAALLT